MTWHASLDLNYSLEHARTVSRFVHQGPLRVMQSHYPEGPGVCHQVLVHPPGGLVGGDTLSIQMEVGKGAHALITTPGATRFYRTHQGEALQDVRVTVADGARLEWLPMETIAYDGCDGRNLTRFELAPTAQVLALDVTALGLPLSGLPFVRGVLMQEMSVAGAWLDKARVAADDLRLLNSPLGWAGQRALGTFIWAAGQPLPATQVAQALEAARGLIDQSELKAWAGVTQAHQQVVVLRVLAPVVEPAMRLMQAVWGQWRSTLWGLGAEPPRLWKM